MSNTRLQKAIESLNQLAIDPDLQPTEVLQFQKAVWDIEIEFRNDRDNLLHEALLDLAYDLSYNLTKEAIQTEIQATIANVRAILSATDNQIDIMMQELQRPALEAARKRKRRFVAGPNGINDEG